MMGDPAPTLGHGLGSIIRTSVATLYSNLVTRPTGRAVRLAIERRLEEARGVCVSILDFSHVGVLDFSCADEVVAKLLLQYRGPGRSTEAFFVASGVSDHHREPIEAVLSRHGLLLVAIGPGDDRNLWGPAPDRLRRTWYDLEGLGRAAPEEYAATRGLSGPTARSWLKRLVAGRVAIPDGRSIYSVCALLDGRTPPPAT